MEISVKSLREEMKISQEQIAILLGVSVRSVSMWEKGDVEPDENVIRLERIKSLAALRPEFKQFYRFQMWFETPMPNFGKLRPKDLILSTEYANDLLLEYMHKT